MTVGDCGQTLATVRRTPAGTSVSGGIVTGICDYATWQSTGGRGAHQALVWHNHTCTWDSTGNVRSYLYVSTLWQWSEPPFPSPLYQIGTEEVHAADPTNALITTGRDTGGFGFVDDGT